MKVAERHNNGNDKELFGEISSFMRARLDIEEVMNDPALNSIRHSVKEMMSDYNKTVPEKTNSQDNDRFIRESLLQKVTEERNNTEIKEIEEIFRETGRSDISMLTADWVKEWHKKQQAKGAPDQKVEERRDFIAAALKSEVVEPQEEIKSEKSKGISRALFIRYISLSAAAVIGAMILISTLLPSSTEKLFNSYYTPFDAISPVTRNASNSVEEIYSSAINSYKSGDYKSAIAGFSEANLKNPNSGSPLFYMGLSNLELGNLSQAISELSIVAEGSGEYVKEAQWYLGLTYIKSGENLKAAESFGKLAKSPGFYRDRSEKILRRLK